MDEDHTNQLPEPVKKELFDTLYEKVYRLCPDRAGLISMCILSFSLKRVLLWYAVLSTIFNHSDIKLP
jgi:hypothetical protein